MLKYLRIALTALSLTFCVLLSALWARSYHSRDAVVFAFRGRDIAASSRLGQFAASTNVVLMTPGETMYLVSASKPITKAYRQILEELQPEKLKPRFKLKINEPDPSSYGFAAPHWFLVLLGGLLAPVPWIPWSTRFGVRTLLIATTLIAVGLGLIVWAAK